MISLDAVRAAVLSDMPWSRLDEIVRAEMAAGRKVKEIFNDLNAMLDEVRSTPGLSEDGDDAILDTLDALSGNCHPECCYYDPPSTTLPTEEVISKLPRWAQVAFAARCARRVYPLLSYFGSNYDSELGERNSVYYAERRAANPSTAVTGTLSLGGVVVKDYETNPGFDGNNAAAAVFHTASNALWAANASADRVYTWVSAHAAAAAANAVLAVQQGLSGREAAVRSAIIRDFDHLAHLAEWHHWTDDTPVPPEVFGPLWPEGPPSGWPADPDLPQRTELPLAFLAREGVLPVIIEDEVVNLFNALNRYYILRTGDRLTVDGDIHTLLAALSPVGVS
jgi:hypothetical protein